MSSNAPENNTVIPPAPPDVVVDAGAPVMTDDPDTVLIPFLGRVPRPRGDWQPTRPGPQGCNAGVAPGYARRKRCLPDRVAEAELGLNEALLRIAALEAANAVGAK